MFRLPNASRQIRCVAGDDGGSPQTFFLRVQGLRGVHREERVSGEHPRFLLDGLGGDAEVNLTVCAVSKGFPDSPVCADSLLLPKGNIHTLKTGKLVLLLFLQISLCVSLSLSLSGSVSVSLYLFVSLALSVSLYLSLSLFFCL